MNSCNLSEIMRGAKMVIVDNCACPCHMKDYVVCEKCRVYHAGKSPIPQSVYGRSVLHIEAAGLFFEISMAVILGLAVFDIDGLIKWWMRAHGYF